MDAVLYTNNGKKFKAAKLRVRRPDAWLDFSIKYYRVAKPGFTATINHKKHHLHIHKKQIEAD